MNSKEEDRKNRILSLMKQLNKRFAKENQAIDDNFLANRTITKKVRHFSDVKQNVVPENSAASISPDANKTSERANPAEMTQSLHLVDDGHVTDVEAKRPKLEERMASGVEILSDKKTMPAFAISFEEVLPKDALEKQLENFQMQLEKNSEKLKEFARYEGRVTEMAGELEKTRRENEALKIQVTEAALHNSEALECERKIFQEQLSVSSGSNAVLEMRLAQMKCEMNATKSENRRLTEEGKIAVQKKLEFSDALKLRSQQLEEAKEKLSSELDKTKYEVELLKNTAAETTQKSLKVLGDFEAQLACRKAKLKEFSGERAAQECCIAKLASELARANKKNDVLSSQVEEAARQLRERDSTSLLRTVTKDREGDAEKVLLLEKQVSVLTSHLHRSKQEAEKKNIEALKNLKNHVVSQNKKLKKLEELSTRWTAQKEQITQLLEILYNTRKENEYLSSQVKESAQLLLEGCEKTSLLEAKLATHIKGREEEAAKMSILQKQVIILTNDIERAKQEIEMKNHEMTEKLKGQQPSRYTNIQEPSTLCASEEVKVFTSEVQKSMHLPREVVAELANPKVSHDLETAKQEVGRESLKTPRDKNLQDFSAELTQLGSKLAHTTKENEVLTRQIKESAHQLREGYEKISTLEAKLAALAAAEVSLLEDQVTVLERVKQEDEKKNLELEDLKAQLSCRHKDVQELSTELAQLGSKLGYATKENEFLTSQVKESAHQLRESCDKTLRLEKELASASNAGKAAAVKISLLEGQVASLTSDLERAQQEDDKKNLELEDLKAQLSCRHKDFQELSIELAQLGSKLGYATKENEFLTSQVKESAHQLRESCDKTLRLEKKLASVTDAGKAAAVKIFLLEGQVTSLTSEWPQQEDEKKDLELENLKGLIACKDKKLQELLARLSDASKEIEDLPSQVKESGQHLSEDFASNPTAATPQMTETTSDVEGAKEEGCKKNIELEGLPALLADCSDGSKEIEAFPSQVKKSAQSLSEGCEKNSKAGTEVEMVTKDREGASANLSLLTQQVADLTVELQLTKQEVKKLTDACSRLKEDNKVQRNLVKSLKRQNYNVQSTNSGLFIQLSRLRSQYHHANSWREMLQADLHNVKNMMELNALRQKIWRPSTYYN